MGRVIDASLELTKDQHRFTVESEHREIVLRASIGAMWVLRREMLNSASKRQLESSIRQAVALCDLCLYWRLGPLRLALYRPGGPTLPARLAGFG